MKKRGQKICIICEGFEEHDYIQALINKSIFSNEYNFTPINVKSINNIVPVYQEKFMSDSYFIVLIFCDTDRGPSEKYLKIKNEINTFHDSNIADEIIIFGNPCTMQIVLSHFGKVRLTSQNKSINSKPIEELTGISNDKASSEQRKELFGKINRANYEVMKENINELSTSDKDTSSTNFLKFITYFESDDISWIDNINDKLYGKE